MMRRILGKGRKRPVPLPDEARIMAAATLIWFLVGTLYALSIFLPEDVMTPLARGCVLSGLLVLVALSLLIGIHTWRRRQAPPTPGTVRPTWPSALVTLANSLWVMGMGALVGTFVGASPRWASPTLVEMVLFVNVSLVLVFLVKWKADSAVVTPTAPEERR